MLQGAHVVMKLPLEIAFELFIENLLANAVEKLAQASLGEVLSRFSQGDNLILNDKGGHWTDSFAQFGDHFIEEDLGHRSGPEIIRPGPIISRVIPNGRL
jgi:hypothetical protein